MSALLTDQACGNLLDARDWRNRMCKWSAAYSDSPLSGAVSLPWSASTQPPFPRTNLTSDPYHDTDPSRFYASGLSQTFKANAGTGTQAYVASLTSATAGSVNVYCDHADGGTLRLALTGTTPNLAMFWLEFSGYYG